MIQVRKKRSTLEMGQDAFLDIVANLVGVLIILVVVLGTQSQKAIHRVDEVAKVDVASDEQLSVLGSQAERVVSAQIDSDRLEKTIREFDVEIAKRNQQRAILIDLLAEAKLAWEDKKKELDVDATEIAAKKIEVDRIESELQQLAGERERIESEPEPVIAVEHLPTPMAKTVFGDELHFRLKNNLVSVVPIDRLADATISEMKRSVQGSREGRVDTAIGPVRGYVAKVEMDRAHQMMSPNGRVGTTRIEMVAMMIEPLKEPFGQPISNVIAGSSELDIELAGRDPARTTITVWVYPDSFAAFRQLKEYLYRKGFATAARPLPMDTPIGLSPRGSRSTAQ